MGTSTAASKSPKISQAQKSPGQNSSVFDRISSPRAPGAKRISDQSKERVRLQQLKDEQKKQAEAAKLGRKMYPDINPKGKSLKDLGEWNKAFDSTKKSKVSTHLGESEKQELQKNIKHKMTNSALLRLKNTRDKVLNK